MRAGDERSPRRQKDHFPAAEGELASVLDLLPLASLVLAADGSAVAVNQEWALLSAVPGEAARGMAGSARSSRGIKSRCGACLRGRSPPVNRAAENSG